MLLSRVCIELMGILSNVFREGYYGSYGLYFLNIPVESKPLNPKRGCFYIKIDKRKKPTT